MKRTQQTQTQSRRPRRHLARRFRLFWWRIRHLITALLIGLAVASIVAVFQPPAQLTELVIVAARDLPAGMELSASDLTQTRIPAGTVPTAAFTSLDDVVGRTLVIGVPAKTPLFSALVSGTELSAPPGTVIVPVQLDPNATALLRPGDHIDLLAADNWSHNTEEFTVTYLAHRALVVPDGGRLAASDGGGGLLGGSASRNALTLVAVSAAEAPALSAMSRSSNLAAVLVQ